jgi:hypothetical protein
MRKKCLLGSVLFSVSIWTSVGLAGDAAQQQHQHRQKKTGWTLEDLKRKCAESEGNSQILPFDSHFECSEARTFWAPVGVQRFALENEARVRFKGVIKDGDHASKWYDVPGNVDGQWGTCDVVEKIRATLKYSVVIHSCADLNKVVSEQSFCAAKLEEGWQECNKEQADAIAKGPFEAPAAARCLYEKTGVVKSCGDGEVHRPHQQCQRQQQQVPQQQGQHQGQHQGQTQKPQQSCLVEEAMVSEFELGADVKAIPVKKSAMHNHHLVILVNSEVRPGGMLAALGLKKGDVISTVNRRRTRNVEEFLKYIAKAKAEGKAQIEYRNNADQWVTATRNF